MNSGLLLLLNSRKSLWHSFKIIGGASDENTLPKAFHFFKLLRTQKIFDCASPGSRACNNAAFQQPILEEYLINELPCSVETANEILRNHPKIRETSRSDVAKATQVLKRAQVPTEYILRHPWLLTLSPVDLKCKLNLLKSVKAVSSTTIPLLRGERKKLEAFLKKNIPVKPASLPDRIDCLCRCLETEPEKLSERLLEHPSLLTMNVQKLQNIVALLKEGKVPRHLLTSDLWIFYLKEKKIAELLSHMQTLNTFNVEVKPWRLRAGKKALQIWLEKSNTNIKIFGHDRDNVDYLAERLQCTREFVTTAMTYKNCYLLSKSPTKLKEVIDFLFEKGYTAEDIRDNPGVFNTSMDTTRKRILEMETLGFKQPPLKLMHLSSKRYLSYIKSQTG